MSKVKWIKITTEIFDDEKVLLLESMPEGDAIIVIWFKLLCLSGKQNNLGVVQMANGMPYTDEMLATIFRRNVATVKMAMDIFKQFGMIDVIENTITIPNWEKHQSLDILEKKREYDKQYQTKKRLAQKKIVRLSYDESYDYRTTNDKNKNKEKENDIKNKENKNKNKEKDNNNIIPKESCFKKPTLESVEEYCRSRNNGIDAQTFIDFYESKGWMVGKNKMKDWKACKRTWENSRKRNQANKPKEVTSNDSKVGTWL